MDSANLLARALVLWLGVMQLDAAGVPTVERLTDIVLYVLSYLGGTNVLRVGAFVYAPRSQPSAAARADVCVGVASTTLAVDVSHWSSPWLLPIGTRDKSEYRPHDPRPSLSCHRQTTRIGRVAYYVSVR